MLKKWRRKTYLKKNQNKYINFGRHLTLIISVWRVHSFCLGAHWLESPLDRFSQNVQFLFHFFFLSKASLMYIYDGRLEYLIKKEIFTMTSNYYIVWNASMTRLKATESNWEQLKIVMSSNVWSFNLFENDPSLFVQWHLYQIRMGAFSSFMTVVICGQALQKQVI